MARVSTGCQAESQCRSACASPEHPRRGPPFDRARTALSSRKPVARVLSPATGYGISRCLARSAPGPGRSLVGQMRRDDAALSSIAVSLWVSQPPPPEAMAWSAGDRRHSLPLTALERLGSVSFDTRFALLLPPHIVADHRFVDADRAYAVAAGAQRAAPIPAAEPSIPLE